MSDAQRNPTVDDPPFHPAADDLPSLYLDLPAAVLAMCHAKGWDLGWSPRGCYLHLESSELIEALRGKRGDPTDEAADVLTVLMSITEHAGIRWVDVLRAARDKVARMHRDARLDELCTPPAAEAQPCGAMRDYDGGGAP